MSQGSAARPTRVAMDLTALLGPRTGVGHMVDHVARGLAGHPSLELTGLLVTWRGRAEAAERIPSGWVTRPLTAPARLAHASWRRFDRPRIAGHDLVHGPNYVVPPTDGAVRLATVHDLTAWRFPELVDHHSRHYPRHLERLVADGGHVHAVSHHVGRELEDELGIDPERIHVVRNGLAPSRGGDGARGRALVGAPYVLAVGTIEPRKDYVTLIRAMDAVWRILPELKLVIAGPPGWGTAQLDEAIAGLGVADRVVRPGYVDEATKADLLQGAEVMAYPSLYEGFGLPILEAMQVGVPVVSTYAGAVPEVAGRAAVLVEPKDPSALAGALLSVIEDDGLRAELARAGRRRAATFSWGDTVDGLVDLYRHLTGAGPASAPPARPELDTTIAGGSGPTR